MQSFIVITHLDRNCRDARSKTSTPSNAFHIFQFTLFENFFKANGSRVLLVFQQLDDEDPKDKKKLIITSGSDVPLCGTCIYFLRIDNDKEVLEKNMDNIVYFGTVEAPDGDILSAIRTMLDSLIIPMLQKNSDWGKISQNGHNSLVSNFLSGLEDFSKLLDSAKANLSET